ncbi:MAG: hypothetical protein PHR35_12595 [Kiritimatiellae bacterium]|nr:hypothetical protein [Kiritimatiellia bacterium]
MSASAIVFTWLWCAVLAWALTEVPLVRRCLDRIRPGRWFRLACALVLATTAHWAATKEAPAPATRIGHFVLALVSGGLHDPSGVVAESAQAAAVEAFEAETADIIATVSGGVSEVEARIDDDFAALATDNRPRFYITQDAPRDLPGMVTNHNLAVTQEQMAITSSNNLTVWFRYSWVVTSAARISVRLYTSSNTYWDVVSYTNSFPETESVGGEDCYRYEFDLTPLGLGTNVPVMIPPYEAEFGGADAGDYFEVPGLGIEVVALVPGEGTVTTNQGFTGWITEWAEPWGTNLQLRCVGGAFVEALWYGTNISGTVTL